MKQEPCEVCGGLFERLPRYAAQVAQRLRGIEYRTFVVGTRLSAALARNEEALWEEAGTEFCEPLRAEVNRELGKLISERTGKDGEERQPDVTVTLDLGRRQADVRIAPLYVYGEYQKLVRGIPQSTWDKYKESVEDIIARPFMQASRGLGHAIHCAGREDIDARCLGRRPFILELKSPRRRTLDLKQLAAAVNRGRKVNIFHVRPSALPEVAQLKALRPEKTYRVLIRFAQPLTRAQRERLKNLEGVVRQQTPTRVLHRRADKLRRRRVRSIRWQGAGRDDRFTVRGEAGLYVKELFTGDNGRTRPSAAGLAGVPATVKALDVLAVHMDAASKQPQRKQRPKKPKTKKRK